VNAENDGLGWRFLTLLVMLIAVLLTMGGTPTQANSLAPTSNLLQFTAGQHVLGFLSDKVYLVGLPHLLSVEFSGTAGVRPVVDNPDPKGVRTSGSSRNPSALTPPLTQVTYPQPVAKHQPDLRSYGRGRSQEHLRRFTVIHARRPKILWCCSWATESICHLSSRIEVYRTSVKTFSPDLAGVFCFYDVDDL
jgi:hypothetical protein